MTTNHDKPKCQHVAEALVHTTPPALLCLECGRVRWTTDWLDLSGADLAYDGLAAARVVREALGE
jgi:hypothetical protein